MKNLLFIALLLSISVCAAAQTPPKPLSNYDVQIKPLLARMTLEEKIGQMIQPDSGSIKDPADIERYFLGSVLSGGSSDPAGGNTLRDWTEQYESIQKHALKTRLAIPLLYGIDAVHGNNNVLGAVVFPHNIGMGATRDPGLVERAARVTAEEVRATGIQWVFAPCVTVPQDERWGRTYEGYSGDPKLVTQLGAAAVRGFQGASLSAPTSVLACAKHFVGDGGTAFGSSKDKRGLDQGDTRVDEAKLRAIHLPGYPAAIAAGVGSIMPSYSSWNGVKCSANKYLLTDVLKKELGFDGFLISDYNAIDQISPDYKKDVETSVNAGMDMIMLTEKYPELFQDLKELVAEGKISQARIDDAVTRILRTKFAMGLMDKGHSPLADRALAASFGSAEHRAVAREAVRKSLVLLKNENKALPLSKNLKRIHVAGRGADDIGMQCGGWTVDWQGKMGKIIPGGTTILAAIRGAVEKGTNVTFSKDGSGARGADVGIVVIGETPYAEMKGDRASLALSKDDVQAVSTMKQAGIPVVVILLSGRPMIIGDALAQADAFIAAWLPGSEGQGVADVIFGDAKPTGKLPVSWPRSMKQIPINLGDKEYNPLFKYGFGLSY